MFERFTETARRVIFFARYEASAFGSQQIEAEHVLLGLLRENKMLKRHLQPSPQAEVSIRKQIQARTPTGPQIATSVDLPLSGDCKRVLAYAAEEATALHQPFIDCGHIVLGLLLVKDHFSVDLLQQHGINYALYREVVRASIAPGPVSRERSALDQGHAFERANASWEESKIEPTAPSLARRWPS